MNLMHTLSAAAALVLAAGSALAQSTIDHNKALSGNITPGDTAGYPITLSVPGSYKLSGNLVVPAGQSGIVITANGVTLDLNGFSISGPAICTGNVAWTINCQAGVNTYGVRSDQEMTVVRNGSVQGFAIGVGLGTNGARGNYRVEDIVAARNAVTGIDVLGGSVARSQGSWNGAAGISLREGSLIDSLATHNKQQGFSVSRALVNGSRTHGSPAALYLGDNKATFVSSYLEGDVLTYSGNMVSLGNNYCNGTPC